MLSVDGGEILLLVPTSPFRLYVLRKMRKGRGRYFRQIQHFSGVAPKIPSTVIKRKNLCSGI
jgi:hypothetical protein